MTLEDREMRNAISAIAQQTEQDRRQRKREDDAARKVLLSLARWARKEADTYVGLSVDAAVQHDHAAADEYIARMGTCIDIARECERRARRIK